jgi:hypothetical protein
VQEVKAVRVKFDQLKQGLNEVINEVTQIREEIKKLDEKKYIRPRSRSIVFKNRISLFSMKGSDGEMFIDTLKIVEDFMTDMKKIWK